MFTQECRRSSYTECRGLGKRGSAKLPTATAMTSGVDANCQYTVEPHVGQKWKVAVPPGASSPVVARDRIFITAFEDGILERFAATMKGQRSQSKREQLLAQVVMAAAA